MTLDWNKPIETAEDPPRPVRVLATDTGGTHPIILMVEKYLYYAAPDETRCLPACGPHSLHLRNVTPKDDREPCKSCTGWQRYADMANKYNNADRALSRLLTRLGFDDVEYALAEIDGLEDERDELKRQLDKYRTGK